MRLVYPTRRHVCCALTGLLGMAPDGRCGFYVRRRRIYRDSTFRAGRETSARPTGTISRMCRASSLASSVPAAARTFGPDVPAGTNDGDPYNRFDDWAFVNNITRGTDAGLLMGSYHLQSRRHRRQHWHR